MKKHKTVWAFWGFAVVSAFIVISCSRDNNQGAGSMQIDMVISANERVTSPNVPDSDMADLVEGNSTFAFDLYRQIREAEGNLFFSPYSISLALAMTYAGAAGETEQQMAEVLNFSLPQVDLHLAFNQLDLELESRGEMAQGTDDQGFCLNIANAIWGQAEYSFLGPFLDVLAENYGAGLQLLDFQAAPEDSRVTINAWVSDRTEGRIEDLIPQGAISVDTRLVLTNAIYFNAAWACPFAEEATQPGVFTLLSGTEISSDMMTQRENYGYVQGPGFQAVEIPYDGQELAMVVLLPDEGEFPEFEAALDATLVDAIISELSARDIQITLPKFSFDWSLGLNAVLANMGMISPFDPLTADFSSMDGTRSLVITDLLHKAFITVDEAGTEAAAATAVIIGATAVPQLPLEVSINRPFIFIIRDLETQAILFVGRVLNPD